MVAAPHPRVSPDPLIPVHRWSVPVETAMTQGVITVAEDATLHQVRRTLSGAGVDAVLVIGRTNGGPLGWITATGLLAHLDADPFRTRATELVTEQPNLIGPGEPLRHAAAMLAAAGVTHLLVGGGIRSIAGVVTARDLLRAAT
jgi:CBS domain-containing protein